MSAVCPDEGAECGSLLVCSFPVERAKLILRIVGICIALAGATMLPGPQTNPEALTQSIFVWLAMMGAFIRPGLILILVGLGCFVLAWILPSGRE